MGTIARTESPRGDDTALVRITRAEVDVAFRPAHERTLARVAFATRRLGKANIRLGGTLFALGMISALFLPLLAAPLAVAGFLISLAGLAATALSALASGPAASLRWLRMRRLLRGGGGRLVTLRGHARAARPVEALDGSPAVISHVRVTRDGRGADIFKAADFFLDTGDAAPASIEVKHAALHDEPKEPVGLRPTIPIAVLDLVPAITDPTIFTEAAIFDGDEIEVTGLLEEIVDPTVADRMAREPPMRRTLRGTPDTPLVIRKTQPDARGVAPGGAS